MTAVDDASGFVLAGDIGGTHARLALARADGERVVLARQRVLRVDDYTDVADALAVFLDGTSSYTHACLAWAGPIAGSRAQLTNGAWAVDTLALRGRFGREFALVNDFHAAARGVGQLMRDDVEALQEGRLDPRGTRLVIGAGTGLGVAYALHDARGPRIVAGEGGHVGFAPQDDEQVALLGHCRAELGRVTAEHLVSGSGIVRIYAFCCTHAGRPLPGDVSARGAAAVAERADAGEREAQRALRLFCAIYGAVAGDHALSCLATGGVYVAGGIAVRVASRIADGAFLRAFLDKGVHRDLCARMPVLLVRDELLGLKGAAAIALERRLTR